MSCRYHIDYAYAGAFHWGLAQGCDFATARIADDEVDSAIERASCSVGPRTEANFTSEAPLQCNSDATGRGVCTVTTSRDGYHAIAVRSG